MIKHSVFRRGLVLLALLVAGQSFGLELWRYDDATKTMSDGSWTFAASAAPDGVTVERLVSGPTNAVAVLYFCQPIKAGNALVAIKSLSPTFLKGVRRLNEIHLPATLKSSAVGTPYLSGVPQWLKIATVVHTDAEIEGWKALPLAEKGPRLHVWLRRTQTQSVIGRPSRKNLVAHMGGNEFAKSNTLPAFEAAIREKIALECDVQLADDGTLYLGHDPRPDYADATKLGELLALVQPGVELQLDCKCERKGIDLVIEAVRMSGAHRRGRILFAVWKPESARKIRAALPECSVWMPVMIRKETDPNNHGHTPVGIAMAAKAEGACGIALMWNEKVCTREFLTELARLGVEVDIWTIDKPEIAAEALARGARWVTTNKPVMIASFLQ